VDEQPAPVYQATGTNRAAAWIMLVVPLAVAVWVNRGGGVTVGTVILDAACLLVAFLAASTLRFCVRATPDHLVVCSGGPVRKIPWSEVKGFGVDERTKRDVFVVLADKRKKRLPVAAIAAGQTSPTEVRDSLQRYWKTSRR
jgi:hypothetical protein